MRVEVYFDFKSPYSYIAMFEYIALEEKLGIQFSWIPFSLSPKAMQGHFGNLEERDPIKRNKVKYLYMDCRRLRPDLTIKAPIRYYDSSLSAAAFYYAEENLLGLKFAQKLYYEIFSNRLEPDNLEQIKSVLNSLGIDTDPFETRIQGFLNKVDQNWDEFVKKGGFGMPSLFIDDELFFGGDRIPQAAKKLELMLQDSKGS